MEITLRINENISVERAAKLTELGNLIEEGILMEQDFQSAVKLYMLAAKAGEPEAFYHMGRVYMNGIGVAQNTEKAEAVLQTGSKQRQYRFL